MGKRKLSLFLGCIWVWWPMLVPPAQELMKEYKYVASKFSVGYHLPTCKRAKRIQVENRVFFTSAQEAIKAGYAPCGLCKPPDKDASRDREILKTQLLLFLSRQTEFQ
jgi:methylphosphotriester-DNA--protein-cysteine methyltransferase